MLNKLYAMAVIGVTGFTMTACGGDSLGDRADLQIDPSTGEAVFEIEMSDGLEVALAGEFDIGGDGYGSIEFVPATRSSNAAIAIKIDLLQIVEDQVDIGDLGAGLVNSLPNDAPLPVAMSGPLASIPVIQNGSVQVDAVVGLIPELQMGAMVYIDQFQSRYFPRGVSICQNFRNSENVAFAAVCLFGPGDSTSGGIFIGGNFGQVLDFELPVLPQPEEPELLAMSSFSSLSALRSSSSSRAAKSSAAKPQMVMVAGADELSYLWTEQRHDPRRKLKRKHLRTAKKILRAR